MSLKLLHTADWHLGHVFRAFEPDAQRRLSRARLDAVDRLLCLAEQWGVDAVLAAGDLFDEPEPRDEAWRGLRRLLDARRGWTRPVVLLPGNHDPLTPVSVWAPDHPFRRDLPAFVRVVDQDDFTLELGPGAVVHAIPCRSRAGERDLALALPARAPGDARLRIGLVHGSTFDLGDHRTNFPIAKDAAERRGLDYLAIGDTHGFRVVVPDAPVPTVYPSAPEPTGFRDNDPGNVALVTFRPGQRAHVRKERVARWTWREETVTDLARLRALAAEDLTTTVLRLVLDLDVTLAEHEQLTRTLAELEGTTATHGRAGVLAVERRRVEVRPDATAFPRDLPAALQAAVRRLDQEARAEDGPARETARRALVHLWRLVRAPAGPAGPPGDGAKA